MKRKRHVMQVRIELLGIDPPIWRRIQIPEDYSLWDLHVAIQGSMGWTDSHLHLFRLVGSEDVFGIPDDEGIDEIETLPDWEMEARGVLSDFDPVVLYKYDFGDTWNHLVIFEGLKPEKTGAIYPRCLDGARKCPPEDCGGPRGFEDFLKILEDPSDPEYESTRTWAGGAFDPDEFAPEGVHFEDPAVRWKTVFADEDDWAN